MALIVMAVHDTVENGRTQYTKKTLGIGDKMSMVIAGFPGSIDSTVYFAKHRMVIVDNASCYETKEAIRKFQKYYREGEVTIIENSTNIGTARAINKGLKLRQPGEYVVKMDNDVLIYQRDWLELMEEAMRRMPTIGILGLKRRDLLESPYAINTDQRSRLLEVPHKPGERWFVVEECKHVMGTCTMLSPEFLDRVGYFNQPGLYGFDDSLLCVRSNVAGFVNCFLHGIDIDHIDPGGTEYTDWKSKAAGEVLTAYAQEEAAYKTGLKDVYYGGE